MAECGRMWPNWPYVSVVLNPDSLNTLVVAGPQGPPLADIHDSFGRTGSEAIPDRTLIPPHSQSGDTDDDGIELRVDVRESWHYSAQICAR